MTREGTAPAPGGGNGSNDSRRIKAYAVFSGGGVKGAALLGALRAAEKRGIDFIGYGGASAGSIVALLASLDLSPSERFKIAVNTDFAELLDDSGVGLDGLRKVCFRKYLLKSWSMLGDGRRLNRIRSRLGLYQGRKLGGFIEAQMRKQLGSLDDVKDISFHHLTAKKCKPLKVIVSDVSRRKALVYSDAGEPEIDDSVLHAVRASISFPFVFEPVRLGARYLVDGGLSCNLPVFLFAREQRKTGFPVFAFDLVPPSSERADNERYRIRDFCSDLIATALEAANDLHLKTISDYTSNIFHIPIRVPEGIDTLKFSLTPGERRKLYSAGLNDAGKMIPLKLPFLRHSASATESVKAVLNVPDSFIRPVLQHLVREVEAASAARHIRAHVMLPSEHDEERLIVTYQVGMESDPDRELEAGKYSKWAVKVFHNRQPTFSSLSKVRASPQTWGLTKAQALKVRPDRDAIFSVPILECRADASQVEELESLGILSIDSETPLEDTLWLGEGGAAVMSVMKQCADIISRILK